MPNVSVTVGLRTSGLAVAVVSVSQLSMVYRPSGAWVTAGPKSTNCGGPPGCTYWNAWPGLSPAMIQLILRTSMMPPP